MSISDIIEAATPGPWIHQPRCTQHRATAVGTSGSYPFICECGYPINKAAHPQDIADARFIATFDPEHVALMEAERVAARHLRSTPEYQDEAIARHEAACKATDAYRKERGL
ncbi:MAG: hypothetical protein RBS17_07485 [Coriobacteriia bacterium]|nr:hypothetical protein [Coriobacteriia bacterium]